MHVMRNAGVWAMVLVGGLTWSAGAQMAPKALDPVPGIIPSGFGEAVDRDIASVRKATERFKNADAATAAGYPRHSDCIANPPQGAMGFHFQNAGLLDAKLEVDKPEILVYEKKPDGSFQLNGVEYIVPISAWSKDEPPTIMGQKLKRVDQLGIYYLHVWIWKASPTGVFADWNPDVKCESKS
jgi:hypothetical protein